MTAGTWHMRVLYQGEPSLQAEHFFPTSTCAFIYYMEAKQKTGKTGDMQASRKGRVEGGKVKVNTQATGKARRKSGRHSEKGLREGGSSAQFNSASTTHMVHTIWT